VENSSLSAPDWAIEAADLTKSFGHRPALDGIDLRVRRGETVAVLGPNGAGKTTLLKLLAGIMKPTAGSILVDGLPLKDGAEEVRRRIGVVTHQTFLYGHLTARENLAFYCQMYDVPHAVERMEQVLAMVGMVNRSRERVGTLSRGMQQRLSLARALLHEPSVMLLDEPEAGLDQQAVSMLWQTLGMVEKRTTIFTTHNLERGLELGDSLLILNRGEIAYQSSKKEMDIEELKRVYRHCLEAEYEILA